MIGTYKIENTSNGKIYVGSSKDIKSRWKSHKTRLRSGYHENDHLQRSWDKYGEESFEFSVIKELDSHKDALRQEQLLLDEMDNQYYNISDSAYASRNAPHKEKTKKKISNALKNNNHPNAYLTIDEILAIRHEWSNGSVTQRQLAKKFGTNQQRISRIVRKETWRYA